MGAGAAGAGKKKQKTTNKGVAGKKRAGEGASRRGKTRVMELRDVECVFSYSGRGFGFATPVEPARREDGGRQEDVFIPPAATKGAMTGDRTLVTIRQTSGRAEGEVTEILSPAVASVVGVLHRRGDCAYVIPDASRLNVAISVPVKDCETLGVGENDKVEVVPDGAPAFNRGASVPADPRADVPCLDVGGRISAVFGDASSLTANYAAVLHEYGVRMEFPERVRREAEQSAAERLTVGARRDLRGKRIFTIDGAGAKDLDDAVSLEETEDGYILGVHIADVSHYVPYGSAVEAEAAARGTSVYFTDKVAPMLPVCLSNGSCSLNAGEDRYALSAEIFLDRNGRRRGARIFKSIIKSATRGVYSEVNDLWEKGEDSVFFEKYRSVFDELALMRRLYVLLRENDGGTLELGDVEAAILLDENGFPTDVVRRERGDAERMIEQFMLQANMGVAETMFHYGLPCLYRIHEEPDSEKIRDFATFAHNLGLHTGNLIGVLNEPSTEPTEKGRISAKSRRLSERLTRVLDEARSLSESEGRNVAEIVSSVLLRCMMKARYSPECAGHFGLGADRYCHFTSPIRRYPDYFVHSVLSAVLRDGGELLLKADGKSNANVVNVDDADAFPGVETFRKAARDRAESSNDGEARATAAERAVEALYMALYMSDKIGERFDGAICSVLRFGIFVRLPNLIEGLVPAAFFENAVINEELRTLRSCGKTYALGDAIAVELISADVSTGKITFKPIFE